MTAHFSEFGPFAVGEICRIVHSDSYPELVGMEVRITAPAGPQRSKTGEVWIGYGTDLCYCGKDVTPPESYLRRRKPPTTGEQSVMQMFVDAPQRQGVPA
jgi:hypothetical protein